MTQQSNPSPTNQLTISIQEQFDKTAQKAEMSWPRRHFRKQLIGIMRHHIPAKSSILDCGCGDGQILKALQPIRGLGVDISAGQLERARTQDSSYSFKQADLQSSQVEEKFDTILLNFTCGYLQDIQKVLENLQVSANERTRLFITSVNTVWSPILKLGNKLGLMKDQPQANWLSHSDLINLLELAGWDVVQLRWEQLIPINIPLISSFFNRFLARVPLLQQLGLTVMIIARPRRKPVLNGDISCSVIVPARNESGHIRSALDRIPKLGKQTEIIFVEGNSTDDTWEVIQKEVAAYKGPHIVSYCQQSGKGKWDAVFAGFSRAKGDVLVIQDGDLTAPPEDLPKFFNAIANGDAEFANGSRLVYPMEKNAMRFLNLLGNKFFAVALTFVLRQPIKDSLCGTKMILRSDYYRLLERIKVFGDFDPFGDFNLLFGSSLLNLKIRDIPVRYADRLYGETNISRFRHGFILIRMTWFALRKLRFHQNKTITNSQ